MKQNLITILACIVAIVAALDNMQTKNEVNNLLMNKELILRPNGSLGRYDEQNAIIEKLTARIVGLQQTLADNNLYYSQPCPDDGLTISGVYPQLVYDRNMK